MISPDKPRHLEGDDAQAVPNEIIHDDAFRYTGEGGEVEAVEDDPTVYNSRDPGVKREILERTISDLAKPSDLASLIQSGVLDATNVASLRTGYSTGERPDLGGNQKKIEEAFAMLGIHFAPSLEMGVADLSGDAVRIHSGSMPDLPTESEMEEMKRIASVVDENDVSHVVDLIRKAHIHPSNIYKLHKIYKGNGDVLRTKKMEEIINEQAVFEGFFQLEDFIISLDAPSDVASLLEIHALDRDTLQTLLNEYKEGRLDRGCKEKIENALKLI